MVSFTGDSATTKHGNEFDGRSPASIIQTTAEVVITRGEVRCGEAPQPAREARAHPASITPVDKLRPTQSRWCHLCRAQSRCKRQD
jgi:hypothetical protein